MRIAFTRDREDRGYLVEELSGGGGAAGRVAVARVAGEFGHQGAVELQRRVAHRPRAAVQRADAEPHQRRQVRLHGRHQRRVVHQHLAPKWRPFFVSWRRNEE